MITASLLFAGGLAFGAPAPLMAKGRVISVDVGHAAPIYVDVTADKVPDLVVGQFEGGKCRVYENHGTATEPVFEGFKYLEAGGKVASVDYG